MKIEYIALFVLICIVPFFIAYLWHVVDWKIQEQMNSKRATMLKIVTLLGFIILGKIYIELVIKVMF